MSTESWVPVTNLDWSEASQATASAMSSGCGVAFGQQRPVQTPQVGVGFAGRLDGLAHLATAHGALDRPRVQAVHPDAVPAQFGGEPAGHPDYRVFADHVVDHERLHHDAGRGPDEDDRPAAAPVDDVLSARHHGVPGAGHVGVDGVAERFGGDLVPRRRAADAGVGHDDVETTEFPDRLVDGRFQRVEVTDVDHRGADPSAVGADQVRRFPRGRRASASRRERWAATARRDQPR